MGFDRKLLKNLDWQLWLTTIFISLFSIVVLRSASVDAVPGNPFYYVKRQILFVVLGNILIAASLFFDYRLLLKLTKPIYFFNLVLLMAVLLVGRQRGGAQRWINIGGFLLQPSEFAKIFIIVVLAHYLEKHGAITSWKELLRAGAVVAVPTVLILRQPDLGTSLVFIVIFFGMLYAAEVDWKYLLGMVGAGLAAAPLMWLFVLEPFQRLRFMVFLDPENPKYRAHGGYQIIQSLIAIGSGRMVGRGYMQGTQNMRNFLPAQYTDFIFSVVGEEFGFIGATLLILAYLFLLQRILRISVDAKDSFGRYVTVGVFVLILFQTFVNIGMTMAIMPVTGVPLPFFSSGGSSYLAFSAAIALVLNIGMRRQKILF